MQLIWTQALNHETKQLINTEHCAGGYLIRLDNDKDVVHPNSQHQERNDLNHNEGEGNASIAEDPQ